MTSEQFSPVAANVHSAASTLGGQPLENAIRPTQYLTFMLGGETFAIGILAIKEIIQYNGLTVVPKMPARIRGVINLRGAVLPVLDLAACLNGHRTEVTKRTCVVIIEIEAGEGRQDVGIMVDAVNAVLDIPQTDMEPAPSFGTGIRADFIQGMGRMNGQFVIVLDVGRALALNTQEEAGIAALGPQSATHAALNS